MSRESPQSDETLAAGALAGQAASFEELVGRYLRPAMALAIHLTRSREDAEDVVQESFHRAVRALDQYDPTRPFSPWFYSILRNVAKSSLEKQTRRLRLVPVASLDSECLEGATPATTVGAPSSSTKHDTQHDTTLDAKQDVERAISQLAPMQKACVELCEIEGATSREAAEMLGISEGTVRTHLHRARTQLRKLLGPHETACRSA